VRIILVLYDLQNEIENYEPGKFPHSEFIEPNPNQLAKVSIEEQDGAKTVLICERTDVSDGITINMKAFDNLLPGDKLTVTGRIGGSAPSAKWGVLIYRGDENYFLLNQHSTPASNELFYLTHLLDDADIKHQIRIRTDHWGNEKALMDFCVDDILITRNLNSTGTIIDSRDIVYSLSRDERLREGRSIASDAEIVPSFLQTSGDPDYSLIEEGDKNIIYLRRRVHDWDGIDINIGLMALKSGNSYTITICGRPEGEVPKDAQLMMQILPGYVWRENKNVFSDTEFVLTHKLSNAEILNAENIRITTNGEGKKVSFVINNIFVRVNETEGAA
jgi:hypothetical protein